ncbi:MAG: PIN domain-containing protein [Acidobacteria bacterium]|nr:PIN domain-containing protein [Acidobacteriota bacterium]
MRLVPDTDVLTAAFRSDRGASRRLLVGALTGRFGLLVSVPLMIEYEAVLTREEHLATASASVEDVMAVLDALATVLEPIRLSFLWRPMLSDATDDMVLETAVNGRADLLVTFNRRHFEAASATFGIEVESPADALRRLRGLL